MLYVSLLDHGRIRSTVGGRPAAQPARDTSEVKDETSKPAAFPARRIWFRASGMDAGQDPYFTHYYRVNFDGTGLTPITEGNASHSVIFSDDMSYYVDTWSRVDLPAVMELRRASDGKVLLEVARTDITDLAKSGWKPPEVFVNKGRDGRTDIWGIIVRPRNFDPARKYPVVELIYAGPQGSFVPKTFSPYLSMQSLAELGFVVVQVDGMGTSNRSKAFHDVCCGTTNRGTTTALLNRLAERRREPGPMARWTPISVPKGIAHRPTPSREEQGSGASSRLACPQVPR